MSLQQLPRLPAWLAFNLAQATQPLANAGGQGSQAAWTQRLTLGAALSSRLWLGPVLRLILHPGGSGAVPSIVAAGLQGQLSL